MIILKIPCYHKIFNIIWQQGFLTLMLKYAIFSFAGRCVGMADDADSKSVAGNRVWVQVPPPALTKILQCLINKALQDFLFYKN